MKRFSCAQCDLTWTDTYSFWRAYQSPCPQCGTYCDALENETNEYHDPRMMDALEFPSRERTEEDLEAERETIHDEIAEALGSAEADQAGESDGEGAGDR
jgi:hypothetical protein